MLQSWLQFFPEGFEPVNNNIAIQRHDGQVLFHTAMGPIFSYRENDRTGFRLALALLVSQSLVTPTELAKALKINRSTIHRNVNRYKEDGPQGLITKKRERKRHKLTGDTLDKAQELLDGGMSVYGAARAVGVVDGTIRLAIKQGVITRKKQRGQKRDAIDWKAKSSTERTMEDSRCSIGMGAKREFDRAMASMGELVEADASFSSSEGVENAGVLLALPILAALGLMDAGKNVYGTLRKGFYGLQTILLTLAFMALLRIKSPEQMKGHSPGELGILLGLDRVPEVNTLRKKLNELGLRNKAGEFESILCQRWADQDRESLGFLYIDGHVRPYHGRKHKLPKTHVARRRLCMPATTDFWVNGTNCEPLFFVTTEANNGMLSTLEEEILPDLRELAGSDTRVTLIFDREGWSPDSFQSWEKKGFDVITYRKGNYAPWPKDCFFEVKSTIRGKAVKYLLGERSINIRKGFWMREVRRLCDNGHQTSVMTTRQDIDFVEIAQRMFSRWNQENFFRYMREEYALDHLVSYDVIGGDVERLVPNPDKKEGRKALAKLKVELTKLKSKYGDMVLKNNQNQCSTMNLSDTEQSDIKEEILHLEKQIADAETALKMLPDKVAIHQVMEKHEVVRLETERKTLTDTIKMLCYRAETSMMNLIAPHLRRSYDEGRAFLKSVFQLNGDIFPDEENNMLTVRFHSMANQRSNRALKALCDMMNEEAFAYPGTSMKLDFQCQYVDA